MLFGVRITAEDVVVPCGVKIDFYVELIRVKSLGFGIAEIVLPTSPGRSRIQRRTEQCCRHWIDWRGDDVIGKRQVGYRIIKLVTS